MVNVFVTIGQVILTFCTTILGHVWEYATWLHSWSPNHLGFRHESSSLLLRTVEAEADRITTLPGLTAIGGSQGRNRRGSSNNNRGNADSFEQFSGYLSVTETRHIFYWYTESQSDPDTDPVVFWTNGGPGCSGLLGFGTEMGPYQLDADGKLQPNPYGWNRHANLLYVEQPAGVGFSYTDTQEDLHTGDAQAAVDNYHLITAFFDRYPERRSNPFYIASESYGGHYIPQLALEILKRQQNGEDGVANFRGFMVGNPYVDLYTNTITQFDAFYSHGLLPKPLFQKWINRCRHRDTFMNHECIDLMDQLWTVSQTERGINPYALDFPVCLDHDKTYHTNNNETNTSHMGRTGHDGQIRSAQADALKDHTMLLSGPPFLPSQDQYRPCAELYLERYLNYPAVRDAIHVRNDVAGGSWKGCGGVHYHSKDSAVSIIPLYKELVRLGQDGIHDWNMLVFSGDDDSICSTAGTQEWIWDLDVDTAAKASWHPWKVNGQTAGFVTTFDLGTESLASFRFVTVHGAGHEVPSYRPMEALELFRKFVHGEW